MRRTLRLIDDKVAAIERWLIVGLLAVMAFAVFLDALHRTFSADEGRLERLLAGMGPGAAKALATALLLAVTCALVYGAQRTRSKEARGRRPLVIAVVATAVLAGGTRLLVWLLPAGLVFSQQMALCFLLWVGLLGASLATREHAHIAFELAGKLWPARLQRPAEWLARALASAFSLFLAVLATAFAAEHYEEWASSGGAAGLFEAFRVPRFLVYGFLPLPFSVMGLRFLGYGVRPAESEEPSS